MTLPFFVVATPALLALACDRASTSDIVRRDSAGVSIVESPGPLAEKRLGWSVDSVPEMTIGALEGEEPYQLFRVAGTAQLPDGRIVVVNGGTQELRFYDVQGRFLSSVGRRGEGPGEYGFPQLLPAARHDTLRVLDWGRRIVLLDGYGRLLETIAPLPRFAFPVGMLGDRLVAGTGSARVGRDSPEMMVSNDVTYEVINLSAERHDTIGVFAGIGLFAWRQGQSVGFTQVPYDVGPSAAVGPNRVYVVTPRYAPQVHAFDESGELREIFRIDQQPAPLAQSVFERAIEERVSSARDQAEAAELRRRYGKMSRPDAVPFFQSLLVDALGWIWLERFRPSDEGRPEWLVLDPDGWLMGGVATPQGVTVAEIGADYLLGTRRGTDDIEQVVRYRLRRR